MMEKTTRFESNFELVSDQSAKERDTNTDEETGELDLTLFPASMHLWQKVTGADVQKGSGRH